VQFSPDGHATKPLQVHTPDAQLFASPVHCESSEHALHPVAEQTRPPPHPDLPLQVQTPPEHVFVSLGQSAPVQHADSAMHDLPHAFWP
jgi:hypothetical protein